MGIYKVMGPNGADTDIYVSLTDYPSTGQVIRALKNEGLIKRNCRFASFTLVPSPLYERGQEYYIYRDGKRLFTLELCD